MSLFRVAEISNFTESLSDIVTVDFSLVQNDNLSYYVAPILSLFVVFLASGKFRRSNRTVMKIPSPPGLPFLGNLYEIATTKDLMGKLREMAGKYPKYYRLQLGPVPVVILSSPETVEKLLSSNDDGHLGKADEYAVVADYWGEGLATSSGKKWRTRRKLLSPLFNYKCFPHFLEVFNRHSRHLVHELGKLYEDYEPKPMQTPLFKIALKIISETSMGVELNDTSEEFDTFFEEADRAKEFVFKRISRPWYRINWIWRIHPFRPVYERNVKIIKDYIFKVLQEGRDNFINQKHAAEEAGKQKKVLDIMLEHGMSDIDIRDETHTVISAGHETAAATLQFVLMLLAQNPTHQVLCQEEIDTVIHDESKCPNGDFTLKALSDLKYMERCLKETLRLYPIAYITGRKLQSPLQIDDNLILPRGTTCMISASDLHMNPAIYPNPEKFDPSRFTPEECAVRHPYSYIPFSNGPRICLGYKYAMAEMKLLLARTLYHFNVSTTDKIEQVPLDASIVLTPVRGYNFLLQERNPLPCYN